jgi:hypothetical protein
MMSSIFPKYAVVVFVIGLYFVAGSIIAPTYLQPHYGNEVFGNVYLLALDNTKR